MKQFLILAFALVMFSCSDDDNQVTNEPNLTGVWKATEVIKENDSVAYDIRDCETTSQIGVPHFQITFLSNKLLNWSDFCYNNNEETDWEYVYENGVLSITEGSGIPPDTLPLTKISSTKFKLDVSGAGIYTFERQ